MFSTGTAAQDGSFGQNELEVLGVLDASRPQTLLRLKDGRIVELPTELLLGEGGRPTQAPAQDGERQTSSRQAVAAQAQQTIPLVAEHMEVGKETVVTGTVRIHRGTETFTDSVAIDLTRVGWEIERLPVGRIVPERPEIRTEGEVTVYPLVEERMVARREYLLLEEVRVRRVATTSTRSASLELKRDVLTIEREAVEPETSAANPGEPGLPM